MAHTAVHKNNLLTDCDNLFFYLLILTKPTCDRSLVPNIDPLVCRMDVITTFIAWSTVPLNEDMVFQHFKENTNVFVFFNLAVLLLLLLVCPSTCILNVYVI